MPTSASPSTATAASSRCTETSCSACPTIASSMRLEVKRRKPRGRARHRARGGSDAARPGRATTSRSSRSTPKRALSPGSPSSSGVRRRRSSLLGERARDRLPPDPRHPADWGTAVNVQAMVFGNMGDDCATGVAFTRNPSTGENNFYGEYLKNAQGEDVVAGIRTPQPINEASRTADTPARSSTLEGEMPKAYRELVRSTSGSRSTTGTCRTSSSPSSGESSGCCRRAPASARASGRGEDRGRHGQGAPDRRARRRSCGSTPTPWTSCCTPPSIPRPSGR